jgi:DNA/RNA-binding domain of Phe-tRNA-synthetase-like protein
VVYVDAAGVLTRHWNHRDADRTKVTEHSRDLVFLLETVRGKEFGPLLDKASEDLAALLRTRAGGVTAHRLTAASPQARLTLAHPAGGAATDRP